MKKSFTIAIISFIVLCGCGQNITPFPPATTSTVGFPVVAVPTSTPKLENTETPWPTLIYSLYPTITLDPNKTPLHPQPTITAPPLRGSPIALPYGLDIEEYQITQKDVYRIELPVYSRHLNKGGWHYWPMGGIINGKLFQAEQAVVNNHVGIRATLGKDEIFLLDCGNPTPLPTVITAWTYGQHWIIQSVCHGKFDVLWDGISLNTSKDYQSSFAFQILGNRPFYLFKRNDQVWLSYDGEKALLGYDEVKLTYCCMTYHPPQHHENMITFYAAKNNELYYVAIGLFDE